MDFQDRPLQCIDCHNEFIFTAGEQQFYDRKGFREIPKRCKSCREARKNRRDEGGDAAPAEAFRGGGRDDAGGSRDQGARGGGGGGARGGAPRGGGGHGGGGGNQRELFDAVCAACGAPTRVPFRPASGRPVYCRECYSNRSTGHY